MIDVERERLMKLGEAARLVPVSRGTGQTSGGTLRGWATRGAVRTDRNTGKTAVVYLEACRAPSGIYYTSAGAVSRFLSKLAATDVESEAEGRNVQPLAVDPAESEPAIA